jgi:hypothetical protein
MPGGLSEKPLAQRARRSEATRLVAAPGSLTSLLVYARSQ